MSKLFRRIFSRLSREERGGIALEYIVITIAWVILVVTAADQTGARYWGAESTNDANRGLFYDAFLGSYHKIVDGSCEPWTDDYNP